MNRQVHRQAPLLVRPGYPAVRIELPGSTVALASAASASARCRVPVDAAIAASLAVTLLGHGLDDDALRRVTAGLLPTTRMTIAEEAWIAQLRHGASWSDDTLPIVWIPRTLSALATDEDLIAAIVRASCSCRLRTVLDLECASVRAGVPLDQAVSSFMQQEEARTGRAPVHARRATVRQPVGLGSRSAS